MLIYDDEKRWTEGYGKAELEEYRRFGKEHSTAIKGGNAVQPTNAAVNKQACWLGRQNGTASRDYLR
jgi:hypothetical protein